MKSQNSAPTSRAGRGTPLRLPDLRGAGLPWLYHIRQPTPVINGDDEPITRVTNGRILARQIPRARLHVIPGGGHLCVLDQAPEAAAVVGCFLNE